MFLFTPVGSLSYRYSIAPQSGTREAQRQDFLMLAFSNTTHDIRCFYFLLFLRSEPEPSGEEIHLHSPCVGSGIISIHLTWKEDGLGRSAEEFTHLLSAVPALYSAPSRALTPLSTNRSHLSHQAATTSITAKNK